MKPTLIIKAWLPLAVGITLTFGVIYGVGQQVYRQLANDPQIQLARDGAAALRAGTPAAQLTGPNPIDARNSLAPFVIMYHDSGELAAFNGSFGAAQPTPPPGTFDYARRHGENRFTWQPASGLRLAAVLVYNGGPHAGFVLAARNLSEVEVRADALLKLVGGAGLLTLLASLIAVGIVQSFAKGK
jgi:hypothetical protein